MYANEGDANQELLVGKHFRESPVVRKVGVSATPIVEKNACLKPSKSFNFKITSKKELLYASVIRGIPKQSHFCQIFLVTNRIAILSFL